MNGETGLLEKPSEPSDKACGACTINGEVQVDTGVVEGETGGEVVGQNL